MKTCDELVIDHKDYSYVGKLAGRYFNLDGSPTPYYRQLQEWMLGAKNDAQSVENEKKIFPPCNSEWNADTGKSLSEVLIFASTNPQNDNRLFIELKVQNMKIPSSEHVLYTNWFLF